MPVITPTPGTFTNIVPATLLATGTTLGTIQTISFTAKYGGYLYARIGRNVTTALTRAGYLAVRPNGKGSTVLPSVAYDRVSSTVLAALSTVSSGGASGTNTVTLGSGTGFAAGDTICLQLAGARLEFARVIDVAGAVLTVDRNFRTSHNASDTVTNQADVWPRIWLPGDEIYDLVPVNNSGQALVFMADFLPYDSDTSV